MRRVSDGNPTWLDFPNFFRCRYNCEVPSGIQCDSRDAEVPDGGLQSIARAGLVRSGSQLFHTAAGSCENLAEAKPTRAEHNGEPILPSISSPLIARSFACGQRESREVPTQASAGKWTSGTNRTDFRATDQRLNPCR